MWCVIGDLILVVKFAIKEPAFASARLQGRRTYLTNRCLWKYDTLWNCCCSITSDLVEKHKHVCLCFWHRALRTIAILACLLDKRPSAVWGASCSYFLFRPSGEPPPWPHSLPSHFIFCWPPVDGVQPNPESKRAHWCGHPGCLLFPRRQEAGEKKGWGVNGRGNSYIDKDTS